MNKNCSLNGRGEGMNEQFNEQQVSEDVNQQNGWDTVVHEYEINGNVLVR